MYEIDDFSSGLILTLCQGTGGVYGIDGHHMDNRIFSHHFK